MVKTQEKHEMLTIGQVARSIGVPATTLRYYEREALLAPTARNAAGYRFYDPPAVERLEFIRAAQAVGFTLDDIRALLLIEGQAPCKQVRDVLENRLREVDKKIAELKRVRNALSKAQKSCRASGGSCDVLADLLSTTKRKKP